MTNLDTDEADEGNFDCVSAMMRYEADELDQAESIRLFQHLVNTGLAWKLQDHYGRRARDLLAAGHIRLPERGVDPANGANARGDRPANKARFSLGQTVVTARALDLLRADEIAIGLARHVRGDWGDVCTEDAQANDEALRIGERLLSVYGHGDRRFWIITERDRSVTTILLPEDY